jgi:hypothetical protein
MLGTQLNRSADLVRSFFSGQIVSSGEPALAEERCFNARI